MTHMSTLSFTHKDDESVEDLIMSQREFKICNTSDDMSDKLLKNQTTFPLINGA